MASGAAVVSVRAESPRSSAALAMIDALCAEIGLRYHRPPSPFLPEEAAGPRTALVIAWLDSQPVGCGALRQIDQGTVEVKRIYVAPEARRRGIARQILAELERLAAGFGYRKVILETGTFQPEAIALYLAAGYLPTAPYGRYVGNPEAHCFTKPLPSRGEPAGGR